MIEFLRFILLGLAVGALYALTAQGLVMIHRGSGVVNMAQGAVGMVGAYLYYAVGVERGWPMIACWAIALSSAALIGLVTHVVLMTRLRQASPLVRFVATLGLFFLTVAAVNTIWGVQPRSVDSPLPTTTRFPLGGTGGISEDRLWLILIACVITVGLWAFYRWTRFGQATGAVAENPEAASALGISPDAIAGLNWAFGSMLAAVTAVLLAPILTLSVAALAFSVLRSLAAALVGRFRSFGLTLAGAMGIGVLESVIGRYAGDRGVVRGLASENGLFFGLFSPQSIARSVGFFVIIAILVIAGRSLPLRSETLDRLPALGSGRVRPKQIVVGVIAALALLNLGSPDLANAMIITMSISIVVLSVVVVTGYVGQVSLTQMGLAGFGSWAAAGLVANHHFPLLLAMLLGVLVTVPLGLLVAVPALRTRGVNLAVLTFGMAVVLEELIFRNPGLNGGSRGHRIGDPRVFGMGFDAFNYPQRYGAAVLVVLVVCCLLVANLRRSASGRQMIAVRGNERAATALGINVVTVKASAFALGAALAAIGGILYSFSRPAVTYEGFGAFASVEVLIYGVIGGVGYIAGAVLAGFLAAGGFTAHITSFLFDENDLALISGALLLLNIVTNPNGFAFSFSHTAGVVRRRVGSWRAPVQREREVVEAEPAAGAARGVSRLDEHLVGRDLRVTNLGVRFGGVVALDGVSLHVRPGEVVGLIGANGAGKTTFIDAVTGFVKPGPQTVIALDGRELQNLRPRERAQAGIARSFQSLELFEDLTVRQNLLVAHHRGGWVDLLRDLFRPGAPDLSPAAEAAIAQFNLLDCLDRRPSELSYGQRRLVSVARAIASSPGVLLLDEPAAGLSEAESRELGDVVRMLARDAGLAVLLIEHDVSMVMSCCDRIAVLDFGRKIGEGTPEEVVNSAAVVAAYLGEAVDESELAVAEAGGVA